MADRKPAARTRTRAKQPAPAPPNRQAAAAPKPAPRRQASRRPERRDLALPADLVEHYGEDRLALIRERIPSDATTPDLARLLLEGIRLGADPLRGDVYLARGASRDGGDYEYSVVATRDALLRFAEAQPSWRGFEVDAVYEGDLFELVEPEQTGTLRKRAGIVHLRPADAKVETLRGAWCIVERAGQPPVRMFARVAEYLPPEDVKAMDPDDPRRRYPDRYMAKVPMCWCLRMAFSLNDVVGADEMPARTFELPAVPEQPGQREAPIPVHDETDQRIVDLCQIGRSFAPALWPPAKVRAALVGADDDARRALADRMRDTLGEVLRRRVAELDAFDREDLDEDTLRELGDEYERVREALAELQAGGEPVAAAAA